MIGFLRGKVIDLNADHVLVDCQNVGYEVFVSTDFLGEISEAQLQNSDKYLSFWIYTQVREDAITLFGFQSKQHKQFFLSLLKVNGVGPKMAMNLLSGASLEKLIQMIESEDAKGLSKVPKVGKKTAEQIILTLKGKLVLVPDEKTKVKSNQHKDISLALLNLGFRSQDIERVIADLPKEITLEDGIRSALTALTTV
jgi:Holliday junction DNA helicase RuvA